MRLHLGVDELGNIITQRRTDSNGNDAKAGIKMIKRMHYRIKTVVGDRAYDKRAF